MLSFKADKGADPVKKMMDDIVHYANDIHYSERYCDDESEYRHVSLPEGLRKYLPNPPRLLTESECIKLGVQQSAGWVHYMIHDPEPHVLLFKREKDYQRKYPHGPPQPILQLRKQ
ncbi:hypothetical protein H4R19_004177 [Coemansia spiralis]|nr:hypothetical protein H4R19_004177 [Coemansia spiralis]